MMRFVKNALVVALLVLTTSLGVFAQTLRRTDDPRNTAPTVGTGGAIGGPTGLFTIVDGQTLRAGEYTFSAAYSNYDRDPGNVDISEVPISFQVGLNDYIELFFNTDAYRQIKVNSPRNLSGFYLPNSRVNINGVRQSAPAFVLAPSNLTINGVPFATSGAIFRPASGQAGVTVPFVAYPFIGGGGATYRDARNQIVSFNGLGPVRAGGGNGADLFPGIGSALGGILPGLVLATNANTTVAGGQTVTVSTIAPSYLADAPFLNREYGESAFNTFTVGAKFRLTKPNSPIGFGLMPFYRFYADKADSASGFNQLQRGASPGSSRGDFGLLVFGDARVAKYANISSNISYTYNSSIKADFGGTRYTLLDRGDELTGGLGIDFPVNKFFQPIGEIRATKYVGGRTPNAFEQDPIDLLAGVRIFPTRYLGMSFAYRYNANQQDRDIFDGDDNNFVSTSTVGGVTTTSNISGVPSGFVTSDDPHGFIVQGFVGRRNARKVPEKPNTPAVISNVNLSDTEITVPVCADPNARPTEGTCNDSTSINVTTTATDADGDPLVYQYTVSGGKVTGTGANVAWDLSGAQPGTYTISVGVDDGCGVCGQPTTREVRIVNCPTCVNPVVCPEGITVSASPDLIAPGGTVTFTAAIANLNGNTPTFNWSVSQGEIVSGQGTTSITVTAPQGFGQSFTATAQLGNIDPSCQGTASATAQTTTTPPVNELVDEFGKLNNDQLKARLDNITTRLQADPNSRIFVISYGRPRDVQSRLGYISRDLTTRLGIPESRIVTVNGGGTVTRTQIYLVPAGAPEPTPSPREE